VTPLPAPLDELVVWRLERTIYVPTWQQGEGAFLVGGRWSPTGRRVIYTSLDPATTILEVAVHKGFDVLDTVAHSLLRIALDAAGAHVVDPADVPNPNWLRPGTVSAGQQAFGAALLSKHPVVLIPSVVSTHSWNVLIESASLATRLRSVSDERFGLDQRLTPGMHPAT
jgi:RES domain-containing protein